MGTDGGASASDGGYAAFLFHFRMRVTDWEENCIIMVWIRVVIKHCIQ